MVGKDEVEGSTLSLKSRKVTLTLTLTLTLALAPTPTLTHLPPPSPLNPHSNKGGELGSLSVDEAVARMVAAQKASLEPHEVPAAAE